MELMLASARKDLRRWRQDRLAVLLWLMIPLMIGGLISAMIGKDDGPVPKGVLLLVDQDDSLVSNLLSGVYGQGELSQFIELEESTLEEARSRIDQGEASAMLVIPEGFGEAFLQQDPVTVELITNPAQTILPGIINDVTQTLFDAAFYLRQMFGPEIDEIVALTEGESTSDQQVAAISIAMQNRIETIAPVLFPPQINVSITPPPDDEPTVPIALLFLPGIILMALMFSANGLAADFWTERDLGTLRRLSVAPGNITPFLAGKALAATTLIAMVGGVALILGFLYHDLAWSGWIPAFAWMTVSGLALFAWFGALQMMAGTRKAANLLTSMLLFPLLMLGGSFFPLAVLPGWIAQLGRLTPNGFIADRLTQEITSQGAWSIDLTSWLIVTAMILSGLMLCAWRLRSKFAQAV